MATISLPFGLSRNNGEAVTNASEIDISIGGAAKHLDAAIGDIKKELEKKIEDEANARINDVSSVKTWVEGKNYLTAHQDISGKVDVITNPEAGKQYVMTANGWQEVVIKTDASGISYTQGAEGNVPGTVGHALDNVGDFEALHTDTVAAKDAAVSAMESNENTIGLVGLDEFDEDENYAVGDCFRYQNKMYKVINPRGHRGAFGDGSDFKETSLYDEAADRILTFGTENCIVHLQDNQGNPMVGVRVEMDVLGKPDGQGGHTGGEAAPRVINTNEQGIARFNYINIGDDYEISSAVVEGYANPAQQSRSAALAERHVYITYSPSEDDKERVYLIFKYENSEEILDRAESVRVDIFYADGTSERKDLRIVDGDTLSFEVLKGTNYTIVFPHVGDYTTPPMIQWNAHRAERSHIVYYYLSTSGLSWLMTDGSERNLNSVFPSDADNVVGLIIENITIVGQDRRFVLPKEACNNVSKTMLNEAVLINTWSMVGNKNHALSQVDGEEETKKLEKFVEDNGYESDALNYVRSIQYNVNGNILSACIPAFAQIYVVAINNALIKNAFLYSLSLTFTLFDKIYTSAQIAQYSAVPLTLYKGDFSTSLDVIYPEYKNGNNTPKNIIPIIDYKANSEV